MDRKFEHLAEYESHRDEFEFVTSLLKFQPSHPQPH